MFEERVFAFMENFLKEWEYPLIHSMSCEQIADIYHISNRCFLVSWFLKLLKYDSLEEYLFDNENDKSLLANLVCSYGFCTEKEKLGFMNGDLPAEEQVKIIWRMCKFISHAGQRHKPEDTTSPVTLERLTNMVHKNLNLFPQYGEIKKLSNEEKKAKIAELKKEIDSLKPSPEEKKDELKLSIDRAKLKEHIGRVVDDSDKMLNEFHKAVIGVNKGRDWSKVDYKMNPEASEKIATCLKLIDSFSQHITDLKTITQFSAKNNISNENNEYVGMICELYKQTKRRAHS